MTLRWKRLFPDGRLAQMTWSRKAAGEEFPLHDHDFPELFWIAEGEVEHQINGTTSLMRRGELMFIRPSDQHAFRGIGARGGVISNFAVRRDIVAHLRRRHLRGAEHAWWDESAVPARRILSAAELHALERGAREIAAIAAPDLLATERFLLNVFHLLRHTALSGGVEGEPDWLSAAREAFSDPMHLTVGVSRLVRLAGCSPEHLSRTVRRIHGITPTELVNRQRLDWAAGELMFTARSISDLAAAAGFESLSHFYHLFRARHGVTPRQFRRRTQPLI